MDYDSNFHSRISPSSFDRLWHCLWWVKAADKWGIDTSSDAANEGTLAHELGSTCLTSAPNTSYYTRHPLPESGETVTEEMADLIQDYVDYVVDIRNAILKKLDGDEGLLEYHIEKRVGATHLHKEAHGTGDVFVGRHFGPLHVIDLKYGVAPVQAKENKQLMGYGDFFIDMFGDFDPIYLHIYQPRVDRKSPFKVWQTSAKDLRLFEKELIYKMNEAEKPNAPAAEGKGCWFCPVKHVCPVKKKSRLQAAADFFDDGEADDEYNF